MSLWAVEYVDIPQAASKIIMTHVAITTVLVRSRKYLWTIQITPMPTAFARPCMMYSSVETVVL